MQSKTVTPTKSQQSVTPDQGFYGLSDVTVNPIPEAYQNVSAVTAAAGDVLANKVIVDATGKTITGTMPNNGAVEKTLDTNTTQYIIPKGYHNGQGIVEVSLEEKTVTPERTLQVVSPTAGKVLGSVTVNAIPEAYQDALETYNNIIEESTTKLGASAEKILSGEYAYVGDENTNTVVKVVGAMPNNSAVSKTLDATSGNQSYTVPAGYHNGEGKVQISLEEKTTIPSTASQNITPSSGKVLSKVTVGAIPPVFANTIDATGTASDILAGKVLYGKDANGDAIKLTGTIPVIAPQAFEIDGLATMAVRIPTGFHNGASTVGLTNDIETALAAI